MTATSQNNTIRPQNVRIDNSLFNIDRCTLVLEIVDILARVVDVTKDSFRLNDINIYEYDIK
jgi:hypothetical protein